MLRITCACLLMVISGLATAGMMGEGMMGSDMGNNGQSSKANSKTTPALIKQYCSRCHQPPMPSQHRAEDWPSVLVRMQNYMIKQGIPLPNAREQQQILTYLRSGK